VAEAEGNRTPLAERLGHNGFEDRGAHQVPARLQQPSVRSADEDDRGDVPAEPAGAGAEPLRAGPGRRSATAGPAAAPAMTGPRPVPDPGADLSTVDETEALLPAGGPTAGGPALAGEIRGAPATGELARRGRYGPHLLGLR